MAELKNGKQSSSFGLDKDTRKSLKLKARLAANEDRPAIEAGTLDLEDARDARLDNIRCANESEQASWKKYFKQWYNDFLFDLVKEHRLEKRIDNTVKKIDSDPVSKEDKEAAMDWLAEHTTAIRFTFPQAGEDPLESRATDDKQRQQFASIESNWNGVLRNFLRFFPTAKSKDEDPVDWNYTFRLPENNADTNYSFWRTSAIITFDVPVKEAPEYIQNLINKTRSVESNSVGKTAEEHADDKSVSNVGFIYAILRWFKNDLNFFR